MCVNRQRGVVCMNAFKNSLMYSDCVCFYVDRMIFRFIHENEMFGSYFTFIHVTSRQ